MTTPLPFPRPHNSRKTRTTTRSLTPSMERARTTTRTRPTDIRYRASLSLLLPYPSLLHYPPRVRLQYRGRRQVTTNATCRSRRGCSVHFLRSEARTARHKRVRQHHLLVYLPRLRHQPNLPRRPHPHRAESQPRRAAKRGRKASRVHGVQFPSLPTLRPSAKEVAGAAMAIGSDGNPGARNLLPRRRTILGIARPTTMIHVSLPKNSRDRSNLRRRVFRIRRASQACQRRRTRLLLHPARDRRRMLMCGKRLPRT